MVFSRESTGQKIREQLRWFWTGTQSRLALHKYLAVDCQKPGGQLRVIILPTVVLALLSNVPYDGSVLFEQALAIAKEEKLKSCIIKIGQSIHDHQEFCEYTCMATAVHVLCEISDLDSLGEWSVSSMRIASSVKRIVRSLSSTTVCTLGECVNLSSFCVNPGRLIQLFI